MTDEEQTKYDKAYDIGCEAEQQMADSICLKIGDQDSDELDVAFQGAFFTLVARMLRFYPKETIMEMIQDVENFEEDTGEIDKEQMN